MLSDKNQDAFNQPATAIQSGLNLEITSEDDLDPDVMTSMTSLGCFKDKAVLIDALLRYELEYKYVCI